MKGRNFLKLLDYTPAEIMQLIDLAADLKAKKKAGIPHRLCEGKNIVLLFEKDSTRTRCAFEVAGADLGMSVTYLGPSGSQMGKKESIADTARVLGRMYDGIEYRGYGQEIVEELAKYAGVPVWNGLTNEFHPTQILADMLTIREHCGGLKGKKLVFMGDAGFNMGNSLMVGCAKLGMHFVACAPADYFPNQVTPCDEEITKAVSNYLIESDQELSQWVSRFQDVYPFQSVKEYLSHKEEKTEKTGFYGANLYVQQGDNRLVYEPHEAGTNSLTEKALLAEFYTETEIEGVSWTVFSVEEYPDLSYVLVKSGTNIEWTYRIIDAEP